MQLSPKIGHKKGMKTIRMKKILDSNQNPPHLRVHGALADVDHAPAQLANAVISCLLERRALVLHREHQAGSRLEVFYRVLHVVGGGPPKVVWPTNYRRTSVLGSLHLQSVQRLQVLVRFNTACTFLIKTRGTGNKHPRKKQTSSEEHRKVESRS